MDKVIKMRLPGGLLHIRKRSVRPAVSDVLTDCAAEDPGVLQHHPKMGAQLMAAERAGVHAVQPDHPAANLVEAHQQVDQRRLAAAGRADDRNFLTRLDREIEILDQRLVCLITKRHMLQPQLAAALFS